MANLPTQAAALSYNESLVDAAIRKGCDSLTAIAKETGIDRIAITRHHIPELAKKRGLKSKPYRYE